MVGLFYQQHTTKLERYKMSKLYTRQGEPIENIDPNGEYVSYNTSPRYRGDAAPDNEVKRPA